MKSTISKIVKIAGTGILYIGVAPLFPIIALMHGMMLKDSSIVSTKILEFPAISTV